MSVGAPGDAHGGRAPVELIATDVDGTMLRSDGTLSARTRAALSAAVEAGIHVVPVTGRPVVIAADVIEASGLGQFWVFANGAVTRHITRDELIRGFWIEPPVVSSVVGGLRRALPDIGFAVEFEHAVAHEPGFERLVPTVPSAEVVEDVLHSLTAAGATGRGRIQKILAFDGSRDLDELYAAVVRAVGDDAVASYSGLRFVELAASAVTKATALSLLAADLGIERRAVAAFGDNHNDVPMLEWAGVGYAMANGSDDAKTAADHVIGHTDDDGLAVAIERLLSQR